MSYRGDRPAGRSLGGMLGTMGVVFIALVVVAVVFIWQPWDDGTGGELDATVPELPGPESELTPSSSSLHAPSPGYVLLAGASRSHTSISTLA